MYGSLEGKNFSHSVKQNEKQSIATNNTAFNESKKLQCTLTVDHCTYLASICKQIEKISTIQIIKS